MLEAQVQWLDGPHDPTLIDYVGFGGRYRQVQSTMDLGVGAFRTPDFGFRRALWDIAFGYVSGFRKRDIAYYVATRSFSAKFAEWVIKREGKAR